MAEMMTYAIDLRSMTQSRGSFTFHFVRYEDCPAAAQEKAIAEAKALAEEESAAIRQEAYTTGGMPFLRRSSGFPLSGGILSILFSYIGDNRPKPPNNQ